MKRGWLLIGITTVLVTLISGTCIAASENEAEWTLNQTADEFGNGTTDKLSDVESPEIIDTFDSLNDNYNEITAVGEWIVDESVDDFGDPTGEKYLKTFTTGFFSNTATTRSDLSVFMFYTPALPSFAFRLIEYNTTKATFTTGTDILLKIKVNDLIYDYTLSGMAPNSDLFLLSLSDKEGFLEVWNTLIDGIDLRCVIYIGSSKYNFTISADGFSEVVASFNEERYEKAIELMKNENYDSAIDILSLLGHYNDAEERLIECEELILNSRYNEAQQLFESKKYSEAKNIFNELGDYSDSKERVRECDEMMIQQKYEDAEDAYNKGDYSQAFIIFSELKDYKDSADKAETAKEKAQEASLEKKYQLAVSDYLTGNPINIVNFYQTLEAFPEDYQSVAAYKETIGALINSFEDMESEYIGEKDNNGKTAVLTIQADRFAFRCPPGADSGEVLWVIQDGAISYGIGKGEKWTYLFSYNSPNSITIDNAEKNGMPLLFADTYTNSESPSLSNFDTVEIVKKVQEALNQNGYDCGTPDGAKGPNTTSKILQYQTDKGLETTGEIDDALLSSLGLQ